MAKQPFAVFDIDGTLIRWQLYHAIADALASQGQFDQAAFNDVREARMHWKQRKHSESFKDYEHRLIAAYDTLLGQLKVKDFEQAAEKVFNEYKDQTYTYTRDLIKQLKKRQYLLFAISNSQIEIVEKIANYYDFDDFSGASYAQKNGYFTGKQSHHFNAKDAVLKRIVTKHKATWTNSVAVGDSASDTSMLKLVERPIAFNPENRLFIEAKRRGWRIVVERKNVIYKLENRDGHYLLA